MCKKSTVQKTLQHLQEAGHYYNGLCVGELHNLMIIHLLYNTKYNSWSTGLRKLWLWTSEAKEFIAIISKPTCLCIPLTIGYIYRLPSGHLALFMLFSWEKRTAERKDSSLRSPLPPLTNCALYPWSRKTTPKDSWLTNHLPDTDTLKFTYIYIYNMMAA